MKWTNILISVIFSNFILLKTEGLEANCGESRYVPKLQSLVRGGDEFRKGLWPWMAAFAVHLQPVCGGNISEFSIFYFQIHFL
jgi:hypothetical protein